MNYRINEFCGGHKTIELINRIWNECVNCTTHTRFEGLRLPPVNKLLGDFNIKQVLKLRKLPDKNIGTITTAFPDGSVARETMTVFKNGAESRLDVSLMNSDGRCSRACGTVSQPEVNILRAAIEGKVPIHSDGKVHLRHICDPKGSYINMPYPNNTLKL